MSEENRGELETEASRKSLEGLVTARTEQLRVALQRNLELLGFLKQIQSMESLSEIHQAVEIEIAKLESQGATSALQFGGNPGEPVPQVDPDDLKSLWRLQRDVEARHPGRQSAIASDLAKHYCKPGADIQAVFYRLSFLWLVRQIVPEHFTAITKDGQPTDAMFRAAATLPAEWMGVGVVRQGPPFDVNDFLQLCAEESSSSEHL